MKLIDWLKEKVTQDKRAHQWFENDESEDRIVRAYKELLSGYEDEPATLLKTTRLISKGEKPSLVTVSDINFYSICAHHFLPFYGKISITYLPGTRIIGLGKFPRLVQAYSRRFQIQEDLVKEIAEELMGSGGATGVKVVADARHMCMCSRGPSDQTAMTRTEHQLGDISI